MILLAGGTGTLGTQVVRLLTDHGLAVRVLTRDPQRARHLESEHVEIMRGDVRDRRAAEGAVAGTLTVISAVHGFAGSGGDSPRTVDQAGNSTLITAARAARARHFILVSVQGVAPDHPMELFRMKAAAEHELQTSGLAWTIIRSSAFMETWASLIGEPLLVSGKMRIFGRGANPINFVSAHDVARVVELAVTDPTMRGAAVDMGGPRTSACGRSSRPSRA